MSLENNKEYDIDVLEHLFKENSVAKELRFHEELSFEKEILSNYNKYFDLIKNFGYGILILPSIIKQLEGSYFIKTSLNKEATTVGGAKEDIRIGFYVPFAPAAGADQNP
mmetsp:Transcript_35580/g.54389  ORF Transcript_35580/g.54389 Transcript_35580/m.54389 type:complete len:110 (+) Transcript_35580:2262-2591(+)